MERPLVILHAAETCRGGVASWLEEALPWQVAKGANVALLIPAEDAAAFRKVKGLKVHGYRWGGRGLGALARFAAALLKAFVKHKPNVVHLHSTFAGVIGRTVLAPWIITGRVRVVYTPHGWSFAMSSSAAKKRAYALIERVLQPLTHATIAVSNGEKELAKAHALNGKRIHIVHNASKALLDKPSRKVAKDKTVKWLFIGRFDRQKGLDVLLNAIEPLAGKPWHLTIVGEPVHGEMPVIPAKVKKQVNMIGWQPRSQLGAMLAAHDVLVMPSRWEGMPMLAIEALSCGTPLLATDVGGLNEVVENGVCGVLVPPDDVKALSKALMSKTATQWHAMGNKALARHKAMFLPERMNAATWKLYTRTKA